MDVPQLLTYIQNIERNKRLLEELKDERESYCAAKRPKLENDPPPERLLDFNKTKQPIKFVSLCLHECVEEIIETFNDECFMLYFYVNKMVVRLLLMEIRQKVFYHPAKDDVHGKIPFDLSVLVTLSYIFHGHLEYVENLSCMQSYKTSELKKCIEKTCQMFVYFLAPEYIKFPCSFNTLQDNKNEFMRSYGIPGVVGAMDCFYVEINDIPADSDQMYRNRKQQISLAVQVICDQNFRFYDVNSRFSGNTQGRYIWNRSHIKSILENLQQKEPRTWLIADRGYNLTATVINPYRNAITKEQESVNKALEEVHTVVQKSFEILKERFRCLKTPLPFNHLHASNIITTCATLHNYLIEKKVKDLSNLQCTLENRKKLPNAKYEDFDRKGRENREFISDFMLNNSLQVLYNLRKNSNLSFVTISGDSNTASAETIN